MNENTRKQAKEFDVDYYMEHLSMRGFATFTIALFTSCYWLIVFFDKLIDYIF